MFNRPIPNGPNGPQQPPRQYAEIPMWTTEQLRRLTIYRAAVIAGFYTDYSPPVTSGDAHANDNP